MRVTFVAMGFEQLAISQLSSIAKCHGHEVRLAFSASTFNDRYNLSIPQLAPFFDDRHTVIKAIQDQKPDVLAFSVLTGTYQWMLAIAREAKALFPDVKTIFGGVHASAVPERVLAQPQVDFVVVGEGDVAFPLILKAIEEGLPAEPIINTRYKRPNGEIIQGRQAGFIQDLDSLPIFDKVLWEDHIRIGDLYLTMGSRGCPYRCTFCFNSFYAKLPEEKKGKYVRQRSVEHVMYELRLAQKRYNLHRINFEDDVFTVDKKWIREFTRQYKKEIDVPFQCLTHPTYMDDDIAKWLSEAGCRYIQLGVQTMDDNFKYQTIKRYEKSDHVEKALDTMRKYNLRVKCDHMFGLPGEPEEAQEAALKLYINHPPHRIQTFWTNILPGTEMVQQALDMGLVTQPDVDRLNDGLGFDFFRSANTVQDKKKAKRYKAYEVFFKLIPVLPDVLRRRLKPKSFEILPMPLCSFLGFIVDASFGLISGNPTHVAYAKHNLYHIWRFFWSKLGLKTPPATRPLTSEPFVYVFPRKSPAPPQEARQTEPETVPSA